MGVFPRMGKIDKNIIETIDSRSKNFVETSKLTAWIRIASAVDNGLILESIPHNQDFASTYGTSGKSGRVGVAFSNKKSKGNNVYADDVDRLHRPSPVITGLEIENGHQGLSRKAKFTITCFTLAQSETLAKYFYQPGYVVLVEYGWNTPLSMEQRADLTQSEGACNIAKYNSYAYITKKRSVSKGSYDGFMGRITGGGYKNGDGETYVMDVELTTLGEIPAYLQVHKSGIATTTDSNGGSSKTDSSLRYTIDTIEDNKEGNKVGLSLFQQTYNQLSNEKRSRRVKSLTGPNSVDLAGNPWTDERNFVNVDEKYREMLLNKFSAWVGKDAQVTEQTKYGSKSTSINIPDGLSLISEHSFIRLELAFEILNSYAVSIKSRPTNKCSGNSNISSYSYIINTNDTIIGAHKWMFSTDGSKLFIPNTNHPSFNLYKAFSEQEKQSDQFIDPEIIRVEGQTINACMFSDPADSSTYAFPATEDYIPPGTLLGTAPPAAYAGEWGYLRNLYINLKFFIDVLSRSNFVAKDIYYEILNGLSASVGSYWQFELTETPYFPEKTEQALREEVASNNSQFNPTSVERASGQYDVQGKKQYSTAEDDPSNQPLNYQISVEDLNFIGANNLKKDSVHEFFSKGIDTPFLSSNLDMPIPAIMRNSILGKASSAKVTTQLENVDESYNKFFSKELDPVTIILNSFHKEEVGPEDTGVSNDTERDVDDIIKSNYELFMGMATVVPLSQDFVESKEKDSTLLNDYLFVASWDDTKILKQLEMEWKGTGKIRGSKTSSAILSIAFSFEIHGVSGLKIGDVFRVSDIPSTFKSGVFQIMEQTHSLSEGLWKTSVTAKLRNFTV